LARVEQARESVQAGRGVRFEDVGESPRRRSNKRLQPARTNRATPATRRRARG